MILQALKEYYDRKANDPDSGIAPEGWEWKEIPFIIILNEKGEFISFDDTREGEGKKKKAKKFLVPIGEKKANGIKANLLWDTANYALGFGEKGKEQKEAFVKRIENEIPKSNKKDALLKFLLDIPLNKITEIETKDIVSFRFESDKKLYCQTDEIEQILLSKNDEKHADGLCLITGKEDKIAILHNAIKNVWGAQTSGANIVSFNQDSFSSYGKRKQQGKNSPIGETAMFAYTTALNSLLASSQRLQVGNASTVFWSAKKTKFEKDFPAFLAEPPKDNPDSNIIAIKTLFESPKTGAYNETSDNTNFYVLGLAPNAARTSIAFWKTGTIAEFANNIRQHFIDLEIIKPPNEPPYYSLWRILVNSAIQDKSENIPPNIAGDFMRSIIDGTPYPTTILQLVLRRIKSDGGNVKPVRAALVKAYLNRYFRTNQKEKELSMALDKEQPSKGYQLGRLFAVLEKIQEKASNNDIKVTIRERYYGSACGSPVAVFPTLMKLKNHHLANPKMKKEDVIYFENLIGEIAGHFSDFSGHLSLHEQGKFAIGYYHQRQDFFTKQGKDTTNAGGQNG